jgi:hypothetical protein
MVSVRRQQPYLPRDAVCAVRDEGARPYGASIVFTQSTKASCIRRRFDARVCSTDASKRGKNDLHGRQLSLSFRFEVLSSFQLVILQIVAQRTKVVTIQRTEANRDIQQELTETAE